MKDLECPYCGTEQDIDHDDGKGYDESQIYQQQCCKCEKYFVYTTYISFSYTPYLADCLNGEVHRYEITHTYPKEFSRMKCVDCGEERELTEEEKQKYI